jgi:hypothetical protein
MLGFLGLSNSKLSQPSQPQKSVPLATTTTGTTTGTTHIQTLPATTDPTSEFTNNNALLLSEADKEFRKSLISRIMKCLQCSDMNGLAKLIRAHFSEQACLITPDMSEPVIGRGDIMTLFSLTLETFPDGCWQVLNVSANVNVNMNVCSCLYRFTGTKLFSFSMDLLFQQVKCHMLKHITSMMMMDDLPTQALNQVSLSDQPPCSPSHNEGGGAGTGIGGGTGTGTGGVAVGMSQQQQGSNMSTVSTSSTSPRGSFYHQTNTGGIGGGGVGMDVRSRSSRSNSHTDQTNGANHNETTTTSPILSLSSEKLVNEVTESCLQVPILEPSPPSSASSIGGTIDANAGSSHVTGNHRPGALADDDHRSSSSSVRNDTIRVARRVQSMREVKTLETAVLKEGPVVYKRRLDVTFDDENKIIRMVAVNVM